MELNKFIEILDSLPENTPLYKDSGLWQVRTDDMDLIICDQRVNESFPDFILRYKEEIKVLPD